MSLRYTRKEEQDWQSQLAKELTESDTLTIHSCTHFRSLVGASIGGFQFIDQNTSAP